MNENAMRDDLEPEVKPIKGDALLFYDLDLRNKFDKAALHAGCPVLAGVKWTATKWRGPIVHSHARAPRFSALNLRLY